VVQWRADFFATKLVGMQVQMKVQEMPRLIFLMMY